MNSPQKGLKNAVRTTLRSFGYDLMPFPMNDWCEQRLTIGRHLLKVFSHLDINCVLDVGAHYGEYGSFLREIGYTGHIISFEPVLANYQTLQRRCSTDSKWKTYRMALGNEDASEEINVFRDTELCSFLKPNDYCAAHMNRTDLVNGVEQVDVRRLDTMFDECVNGIEQPHVYLKLDTQGYDLNVLEGAAHKLDRILGLQSELSVKPIYGGMTNYLDALPKMMQFGFEVSGMYPVSFDWNLRVVEFDCVMIRGAVKEGLPVDGGVNARVAVESHSGEPA